MSSDDPEGNTRVRLKRMFVDFFDAMAAVIVFDAAGDQSVGSAFHVGDGVFVTARHVFASATKFELRKLDGGFGASVLQTVTAGPVFHPNPDIDVAAIKIEDADGVPVVPLGSHLDDWIDNGQFILNDVLVMGFPPIPLSSSPVLLASRGEVNAVVDPILGAKHPHFVLSTMARGGYSGGVVLSEWGFALGLIASSFVKDHAPEELGYLTALTVEPIYECLAHHKMLPPMQSEPFDGLWNTVTTYFGDPSKSLARAFIDDFNDGTRLRLRFASPSLEFTEHAMTAAKECMADVDYDAAIVPVELGQLSCKSAELQFESAIARARAAIEKVFTSAGHVPVSNPITVDRRG